MATIIDTLLVTLGLDSKDFEEGTKRAQETQAKLVSSLKKDDKARESQAKKTGEAEARRSKQFEEQGRKTAETLGMIRRHALGLVTVLAGGIGLAEFAKSTIFTAASLGRLSHNMGMSIKDLQGWEFAARSVGASGGDMAKSLQEGSLALANMKYNGQMSGGLEAFYRYGGGQFARPKNGQQLLLDESSLIAPLYAAGHHNEALARWLQMGNSEGTFNLAKHGPRAMEKLIEEGKKKAAITRRDAQASEQEQKALVNFGATVRQVATGVLFALLPTFNRMLAAFQSWGDWLDSHQGQLDAWAHDFGSALQTIWKDTNKGVQALGGWKVVLAGLVALKLGSSVRGLMDLAEGLWKVTGGLKGLAAAGAFAAGLWVGKHINTWINDLVSMMTGGKDKTLGGWLGRGKIKSRQNLYKTNNPGNLRSWGQTPLLHGFANFATRKAGTTALAEMLMGFGHTTLQGAVGRYEHATGSSLNLAEIERQTGYKGAQALNMSDPAVLGPLMAALIRQEKGSGYEHHMRGLIMPSVNQAATVMHHTETHIGAVTIHTQATDARGIMRSLHDHFVVPQANRGMS